MCVIHDQEPWHITSMAEYIIDDCVMRAYAKGRKLKHPALDGVNRATKRKKSAIAVGFRVDIQLNSWYIMSTEILTIPIYTTLKLCA